MLPRILKTFIIIVIDLLYASCYASESYNHVSVMSYITDMSTDASKAIQECIDENPNSTIYFPDGTYLISSPIKTSAAPKESVCLELSNYAIIKASDDWHSDEAMIQLGGKRHYNTILIPGSNYYLAGGVIDCSGIAKGISIESGRETSVRFISIKNAQTGIHIKKGANNSSSDSDLLNINITGNQDKNSIGLLIEGYDNTVTNMRIYQTQLGVKISSEANILRNIHVLYGSSDENLYQDSFGFVDVKGNNWYDFCYSDQYATAFKIASGSSIYHNCFAYWYTNQGVQHTAFLSSGPFDSIVTNFTMNLTQKNTVTKNILLQAPTTTGKGCFENLRITTPSLLTSDTYKKYVK